MVNLAEKKSRTMRWPGLGGWQSGPASGVEPMGVNHLFASEH
jgi:hypothetical protein